MGFLPFLPIMVIIIVYLAILIGIFVLINYWVNKNIVLKREQNDLLREIIKKMENKAIQL